ncbi:glutamine amidotransferase-related protein [Methylobacterium radiodurans]|uniref:Glutamine amidotransferase n=1 Tax=Methylobacterium radiodurans TaxID=2202828 RepID=A0A2U8W0T3_9HYPH|nr:gamma-glutamyl-gamma-aminobutyrate hydrolase family protein [Methylobacterium radiodurans]AWN39100.1 glutamine amidotransferase [Methylobacterium radiodurans]
MIQILVADGNVAEARREHVRATGETSAEAYAALLAELAPDAACTILEPADTGAALPAGADLAGFDGVVFTGSQLHVSDDSEPVRRQRALMRTALEAGLPVFGSCWGVQLAAAAAGGSAGPNPRGPEYGFARRLVPTGPGREHPLLAGRPPTWDAPAMHLDAVLEPPPGAEVLAGNGLLDVQALALRLGAGTFWGTQYHPELDFGALSAMLRLSEPDILKSGLCRDGAALTAYADEVGLLGSGDRPDLAWRHGLGPEVLEAPRRRREIGNFLAHLVRPRAARR